MKSSYLAVFFTCLMFCVSAWAGDGGCYFSSYYSTPNWWTIPCCGTSCYNADSIPYFAAHPPVYYSYHVARSYGESPFPRLPGMPCSATCSNTPRPLMIANEYVHDAAPVRPGPQRQTRAPLRIVNPFVESSHGVEGTAKPQNTADNRVKPLTVYPMSLHEIK